MQVVAAEEVHGESTRRKSVRALLLHWALANAIGWLFSSFLVASVQDISTPWRSTLPEQWYIPISVFGAAVTLLVSGLLVSLPQARVLASIGIPAPRWIAATSIGFPVGFLGFGLVITGLLLPPRPERMTSGYWLLETYAPALGFGVGVGILQWPVLRPRLRRSTLWVVSHALGFPLGLYAWHTFPELILRILGFSRGEAYQLLSDAIYSIGLHTKLSLFAMGMTAAVFSGMVLLLGINDKDTKGAA